MRLIKFPNLLKSTIDIANLSIGFPNKDGLQLVVDDVSLQIPQAKTLALVGESGSGKSITSLAVMQLLGQKAKISNGQINLHFKDNEMIGLNQVDQQTLRRLRGNRMAMIFQEPMSALNPVLKCGSQVAEIIQIHQYMNSGEIKQKVLELFRSVRLPQPERIYKSYPHELSGGQKQRLMIAMAMANEPELLIADEPTTALDVSVQKTILELINEFKERYQTSVLFITHDLGLVSQISDQLAVMYKGKIVEQGETKAILNHPQHPYTQALLACRPPLDTRPARLPSVNDYLSDSKPPVINLISVEERKENHQKLYLSDPLLKVINLTVEFPLSKNWMGKIKKSLKAVDHVNFQLFKGETLGLVGESGCGKSTLSHALIGLQKINSGHIWLGGLDAASFDRHQWKKYRQKVQIIFQDPYGSLNPALLVGATITEPMRVHFKMNKEDSDKEAMQLLEKCGLPSESFYKYPSEFSGGQRQRISIARALAMKPEIIICDESVSALDVSVQAQILNLLNQLKEEFQLSYLFISHDLAVVKYMSDRVMVMKDGIFVEVQEADELYRNPQTDYTRMLISSIPKFK